MTFVSFSFLCIFLTPYPSISFSRSIMLSRSVCFSLLRFVGMLSLSLSRFVGVLSLSPALILSNTENNLVKKKLSRTKTSSSVEKTNRKSQELTESREERALEETREGRGISDLPERREGPNTSEVREGRGLWDNLPSNQHSTAYQRHADPGE